MLLSLLFYMFAVISIFYLAYKIIFNMPQYIEVIEVDEKEFEQTNIKGIWKGVK